jgi:hypothetical protein
MHRDRLMSQPYPKQTRPMQNEQLESLASRQMAKTHSQFKTKDLTPMPTTTKTKLTPAEMAEQLREQKQAELAAHTSRMIELDEAITQAEREAIAQSAEQAKAEREALLTESLRELRELPTELNLAACQYVRLIKKFQQLALTTNSQRSSLGGYRGEANYSDRAISQACKLPIAFCSDNGEQVFLATFGATEQVGCDRMRIARLQAAVADGDVEAVKESMGADDGLN